MNFRQYCLTMAAGTFLSLIAWLLIVFLVNPSASGWLGITLFYASIGVTIAGFSTLFSLAFNPRRRAAAEPVFALVRRSLGRGLLIAGGVVLAAILQHAGALSWFTGLLLFLGGGAISRVLFGPRRPVTYAS